MDGKLLQTVGQVAGLGGLALGVALLLLREIIRKNIFPKLEPAAAAELMQRTVLTIGAVVVIGMVLWAVGNNTQADCGGVAIGGGVTGSTVTAGECQTKK